jgi:hypothetical protein
VEIVSIVDKVAGIPQAAELSSLTGQDEVRTSILQDRRQIAPLDVSGVCRC